MIKKTFKEINLKNNVWIVGDVHGQYKKLKRLLKEIPKKDTICFVGDLVDRGSKSKEIIKLIKRRKFYCVKGNHEELMIDSIKYKNEDAFALWIRAGGSATLYSYMKLKGYDLYRDPNIIEKIKKNKSIMKDIKWLENLPLIIKFSIKNQKPLYISHSGIELYKNDKKIIKKNPDYITLWNREKKKEVNFAINIHGHTIRPKHKIKISKSQIDIDTGASLNLKQHKNGYGMLTAIEYPTLKKIHIK